MDDYGNALDGEAIFARHFLRMPDEVFDAMFNDSDFYDPEEGEQS